MNERPTWQQRIETTGDELVAKVKELIADGGAKKVTIRTKQGEELLSVPLVAGVVGGGIAAIFAPALVAVGAIATLVGQVTLEVERDDAPPTDKPTDQ